jgi:hypothetical protein
MSDTPPGFPPEDDGSPDGGGPPNTKGEACANCAAAHHTWQCPEIWKPLRMDALTCDECKKELPQAQFRFERSVSLCICDTCYSYAMSCAPIRCDECGDVIDHPGMCLACQEWERIDNERAIIHRMVDRGMATPLLRSGLEMSLERVVIDGVPIPF